MPIPWLSMKLPLCVFHAWLAAFAGVIVLGLVGCVSTPSTPGFRVQLAPQTLRSDEATLLWDKPDVATVPTDYEILSDDRVLGSTTKTHFTLKVLTPEHRYQVSIRARNAGGLEMLHSDQLELRTPAKEPVLSVVDYGAKGDGQTNNTRAIQAAIDACPRHGVVVVPQGVFVSGALFLKSDMTLHIAAGDVLQGSRELVDYEPFILNRFEGWEMKTYASLLNAGTMDHNGPFTVRNLSIRGEGKITGGGDALGKAMIAAHGLRSRGRLICLMNCSGVEIQGLTIEESPCWTLHYIYCENVSLHDLTIASAVRNGDGIDPDSSTNSYIFNCSLSTGDDCIAIKSGKNPEGNIVNRPTENIRIVDCRFTRGHGISIGSEMSGGVRNVLVQDCVAGALLHGLQIKATKDRGNVVENVVVRDCQLQKISILTSLNYNNDGQPAPEPPWFRNFRFVNIDLTTASGDGPIVIVNGFDAPGHRTTKVRFENVRLPAGASVKVDQAEDVTFTNVVAPDGSKPRYDVTRSERILY